MRFRPCIDLHNGKVKQIVGSTLSDAVGAEPETNFIADRPASHFASMYRQDGLAGGHVIMLGPGNEDAARSALHAYPGGLHIGGGINLDNAAYWLDQGAAAVIVTSYVFHGGAIHAERLAGLVRRIGRDRLVLDLSCRKRDGVYFIVTDRWQKFTNVVICEETLATLGASCCEFLIHAADVEGRCAGMADDLAAELGRMTPLPTTYAGGISSMEDIARLRQLGRGRLDFTVGSSLDIFGGRGLRYRDMVVLDRGERGAASV